MEKKDVRWLQRYDSFQKALNRILVVTLSGETPETLSELEQEGLVQRFEYTTELAWKVLKDVLEEQGFHRDEIAGPMPTLQKAFETGLINRHDEWRKMIKARNTTSHTYNEGDALQIVQDIYIHYAPLLKELDNSLRKLATI